MSNELLNGIFDNSAITVIDIGDFCLCIGAALIIGVLLALSYAYRSRYSKSFILTLGMLPAIVCVVIMMVNGHIGAGVAVAGAFSLVRFRSAPGTAREIAAVFTAMASGLICGMGYLAYAGLFAIIICVIVLICSRFDFGFNRHAAINKSLRITIPEDLDYTDAFDDIFEEYTSNCQIEKVKTTNMGSMFRLTYSITLKNPKDEKEFIDKLRTRNGNLEIMISKAETQTGEL